MYYYFMHKTWQANLLMFFIDLFSTIIGAIVARSYNYIVGAGIVIGGLITGLLAGYLVDKALTTGMKGFGDTRVSATKPPWKEEPGDVVEEASNNGEDRGSADTLGDEDIDEGEGGLHKGVDEGIHDAHGIRRQSEKAGLKKSRSKWPKEPTPVCSACGLPKQWADGVWRCPFCEE